MHQRIIILRWENPLLTDEPRPQRDTSLMRLITRSQKSETQTRYVSKRTARKGFICFAAAGDDSISWQIKPGTRPLQVQRCYH